MSSTEIFRWTGSEWCCEATIRNSWRGAMHFWNYCARTFCQMDSFPLMDESKWKDVFSLYSGQRMPKHFRILMAATMDRSYLAAEDREAFADAAEKYGYGHPTSSYLEQAAAARTIEPGIISFRPTTVSDFWFWEYDEENEETIDLPPEEHGWNLMEEICTPAMSKTGARPLSRN